MFRKKRTLEQVEERYLKAYRELEEAKKELRQATGWSFYTNQTIVSKDEDASIRDNFVNRINLISKEYNTK